VSANNRFNQNRDDEDEFIIDESDLVESFTIFTLPERRCSGRPRRPRYPHTPEQLDAMLERAGYDPTAIPQPLRIAALEVALCWQKQIVDERTLLFVVDRKPSVVRAAIRALHDAKRKEGGAQER
jgi:hypothetical protein